MVVIPAFRRLRRRNEYSKPVWAIQRNPTFKKTKPKKEKRRMNETKI
jgi:hypothetical protein